MVKLQKLDLERDCGGDVVWLLTLFRISGMCLGSGPFPIVMQNPYQVPALRVSQNKKHLQTEACRCLKICSAPVYSAEAGSTETYERSSRRFLN